MRVLHLSQDKGMQICHQNKVHFEQTRDLYSVQQRPFKLNI